MWTLDFQWQESLEEVVCWVLQALRTQQLLNGNCLFAYRTLQ